MGFEVLDQRGEFEELWQADFVMEVDMRVDELLCKEHWLVGEAEFICSLLLKDQPLFHLQSLLDHDLPPCGRLLLFRMSLR